MTLVEWLQWSMLGPWFYPGIKHEPGKKKIFEADVKKYAKQFGNENDSVA